MDEAREDPESVIVQEPWSSQLDWSQEKDKAEGAGAVESARRNGTGMRPKKGYLPVRSISRLETELHRSWRGEATFCSSL